MPERLTLPIHGPEHVPGGPDPIPFGDAIFEIKVFEDTVVVAPGDGKFKFAVPEDLDQAILSKAEAWVTGASSSGDVVVSLTINGGPDMLADPLVIDVGEANSKDSGSPHSVDPAHEVVSWGDEIWINVDNAGSDALGLGVCLYFISAAVGAIVLRGAKGEPGGVTEYEGDWTDTTTYPAGSVVVHDGIAYLSTADHTADPDTEPGTGVDWETVWTTLVTVPTSAALSFVISSSQGDIPDGTKVAALVPWPCEIEYAILLADVAGDAVVDIWRTDFGGYPADVTDTICGGTPPTLIGAIKNFDSTLLGWSTSLAADDLLVFHVSGCVAVHRLTLALKLAK
jgi:hypothetical protein